MFVKNTGNTGESGYLFVWVDKLKVFGKKLAKPVDISDK